LDRVYQNLRESLATHGSPLITECWSAIHHWVVSTKILQEKPHWNSASSSLFASKKRKEKKTNLRPKNLRENPRELNWTWILVFIEELSFLEKKASSWWNRAAQVQNPCLWFDFLAFNSFSELRRASLHFGAAQSLDRQVTRATELVDRSTLIGKNPSFVLSSILRAFWSFSFNHLKILKTLKPCKMLDYNEAKGLTIAI
jgi:hypothetical protein